MAHIIIRDQYGQWSIHDDRLNFSRNLTEAEVEKLKIEFPELRKEGLKVFSTDRVKTIANLPILASEFWTILREALGPDTPLIIEYDDPEKPEFDAPYKISFFQYTEDQKGRMKASE